MIVMMRVVMIGGVGSVSNGSGKGDTGACLSNESDSGPNGAASAGGSGNDGCGSDNDGDGSVNGDCGEEDNRESDTEGNIGEFSVADSSSALGETDCVGMEKSAVVKFVVLMVEVAVEEVIMKLEL